MDQIKKKCEGSSRDLGNIYFKHIRGWWDWEANLTLILPEESLSSVAVTIDASSLLLELSASLSQLQFCNNRGFKCEEGIGKGERREEIHGNRVVNKKTYTCLLKLWFYYFLCPLLCSDFWLATWLVGFL